MADDRLAPSAFEETQKLAYALYQERDAEGGHEFEDWISAETKLRAVVNNSDRCCQRCGWAIDRNRASYPSAAKGCGSLLDERSDTFRLSSDHWVS